MYVRYFIITVSSLGKRRGLHWKKLESLSPKDALCQKQFSLAKWFWRRRFLNFVNVCSLFHNYLPLEKGVAFIRRNLNPFHPRMICAKFGWFRKRRCICKKFKDRRTTGDQKSSPGELKSKYPFYYTPDTLRNKISFLKLHGDTNMQLVT